MNIIKNLQGKNCLLNYVSLKDTNHLKNKPQRVTRREAFVIECADNVEDASNGVLEDGDLYYLNIPEEEMLCKLRKDIVTYYME